jgi:hypothetical protein
MDMVDMVDMVVSVDVAVEDLDMAVDMAVDVVLAADLP